MLSSLFIEYQNADIPDHVDFRKEKSILKHKQSIALLRWPNGKPCSLINLWLLETASKTTGQSLRQYSSNISHYVKYCYKININFTDTTDAVLFDIAKELTNSVNPKQPDSYIRGRNRVRAIISTIIDFLRWLETNICESNDQTLIGPNATNAKVTVTQKVNTSTGRTFFHHPAMPVEVSEQNDKRAMPDSFIEAIENEISKLLLNFTSEVCLRQSRFVPRKLFKAQQEYLYSRRVFMNWCMKNTGLRPGELVSIPLPPLFVIYQTRDLQIPTLKRRVEPPPIRHFRVNLPGCRQVSRYVSARDEFIQQLISINIEPLHQDALFLTQQGSPLSSASLAKDFSRLAIGAGLGNEKVCLSMYRHRFITTEILLHLRELLGTNNPNREILSEALIKSICERIRKKLGHGSPSSMWHYFDAAFDILDFWGSIDSALEHSSELDDIKDQLRRLHNIMLRDGATEEQMRMVASLKEQMGATRAKRGPNI
jgi:site-specific recombinase XerD